MSAKRPYNPLSIEHLSVVDAAICKQTLAESVIDYSIEMGHVTVHHGCREGAPIVVVEHHDQQPDQLSAVWYDDSQD
jgi:hypothetical protein